MVDHRTIVALASGALPSAIALIRISGPDVPSVAAATLGKEPLPVRKAALRTFRDANGAAVDQVVATYYQAPASYTGEDMLEFGFHGGVAVVERALGALIDLPGLGLAEPGAFTRRAVLAGKLDLLEAEAVADLVEAETEAQRAQALSQLGGGVSQIYDMWRAALVEALSAIEVSVDFPDEGDVGSAPERAAAAPIERLSRDLGTALASARAGLQVRSGTQIAIIGPPNAGKSSFLNALAGRDVAIVTDRPGTTRDVLETRLNLNGHLVRVCDTAGLRETGDEVEAEGVRRAQALAAECDVLVGIYDVGDGPGRGPDFFGLEPDLVLANKIDLLPGTANVSRETFAVSAQTGEGLDAVLAELSKRIEHTAPSQGAAVITRQRHLEAVSAAKSALERAGSGLSRGAPPELVAEDVRQAIRALGSAVGRVDVEDVLGSIFSSFCIGK